MARFCVICGNKIANGFEFPLQDATLCASCGQKLPPRPGNPNLYTLDEAKYFLLAGPQNYPSFPEASQNWPGNSNFTVKIPEYIVLQVVLKEAFIGTGSKNLSELESVINQQAAKGYRLHTFSCTSSGSSGFLGGDRIQATMVFEKL